MGQNNYWRFVKYLWDHRDQQYYFRPSTVTEANREFDGSLPAPALTSLEAGTLFEFLADKGLVTEKEVAIEGSDEKETVYRINKIEAYKWVELIAELKKSDWRRHWIWTKFCNSIFWLIMLVVAGVIGATVKESTEHLLKKYVFKNSIHESSGNSTKAP